MPWHLQAAPVDADPPQAEAVMKRLFGIDSDTPPKVYRVKFRDADGSIGRRDFATHWIHWYPAKMFHRIPQAILGLLSSRSPLTVLDPFCGSGTVLLEGVLRGHRIIGIDVNPLARLISRVKTVAIDPRHIRRHVVGILRRADTNHAIPQPDVALDFWFKSDIRPTLHNLFESISYIDHVECREFFQIAFSSIIRSCSLADPRIPPPVKLNANRARTANQKYRADLKRALKLRSKDVHILFARAVDENLNRMKQLHEVKALGQAMVLPSEFEAACTGLPDASVDLVVTSPPYCGAQKYARSLRLEMLMMNISPTEVADADRRTLGTERVTTTDILTAPITRFSELDNLITRVRHTNPTRATMLALYVDYLDRFAKELVRVLRVGAHAFVTFGIDRISGIDVNCADIFVRAALANGLHHIATLVDTIPSRGMITKRHSTAGTIAEEYVVWVRN